MAANSNQLAIVTGASSGIGYELAKLCAQNDFNLIIASDEPEIHTAARTFQAMGVEVKAVQVDLATAQGVKQVYDAIQGRPVDALLANAGHGLGHAFKVAAIAANLAPADVAATLYGAAAKPGSAPKSKK